MAKIIIVDVGAHEAQEFKALFHFNLWNYFRNWLKHLNRVRRSGGKACSVSTFTNLLSDAAWLKSKRTSVYYVLVEPNKRLCSLPIYSKADMYANVALASEDNKISLRKLYYANMDNTGQGSSLFEEKPNVSLNDFDWVVSIDPEHFFLEIVNKISKGDSVNYVLRLNNEGAEVEVIEAAQKVFGESLIGILGSLNDVEKVKGAVALQKLNEFMSDKEISFLPFHSDFSTWPNALAFIRASITD